jgi:hypothetical protein
MHVEITRILANWLKHPDYGVNAMLATLPRFNKIGSTTSKDPKPADVTVFSDVDTPEILTTSGWAPPKIPALIIMTDLNPRPIDISKATMPGHFFTAFSGIGYFAEMTEREKNIVQGGYVLRAVKKSLKIYNEPKYSNPNRELNSVQVSRIDSVELQRVASAVPESLMLGVVFVNMTVLDKAP